MLEKQFIICYFFFADDGGNNAYGIKEEMKKLDIFDSGEDEEATHSKTQLNVVE